MVAEVTSQRSSLTKCAVLGFGGMAGLRHAFVTPQGSQQVPQLHVQGEMVVGTSAPRSARSGLDGAESSWAAPAFGLLGVGAALALTVHSRDESRTAMQGKHDRRTFRGKLHAHTFGKCRMRPEKARLIRMIKNGLYDPTKAVTGPDPDRPWDYDNLLENPMYYVQDPIRNAYIEHRDERWAYKRKHWKEFMGKKGPQHMFKNWTPPELLEAGAGGDGGEEPPKEAAACLVGEKISAKAGAGGDGGEEPPKEAAACLVGEKISAKAGAGGDGGEEPPKEAAACLVGEKISAKDVKTLRERSRAGILDCQKALKEVGGDMEKAMDWLKKKGIAKADKKAGNIAAEGNIASYVHFNSKIAVLVEVNSETDFVASNAIFKEFTKDVAMQIAANPEVTCVSVDDVPAELREKERSLEMQKEDLAGKPDDVKAMIVDGRLKKKFEESSLMCQKWLKDESLTVEEALKATIAKIGENLVIRRFSKLTLGEGLEKKADDFAAGVEKELSKWRSSGEEAKPAEPEAPKPAAAAPEPAKEEAKEPSFQVSAGQVKELRERSGAAILDSKKALVECEGDIEKAMEWLKKKGMTKADKKAGNVSVEGVVASYVHFNSKLGVIVEVNSETDFVAMNSIFKEFAKDVAMQIAAIPSIECISADDVAPDVYQKEKDIEMAKEDLAGKPDDIKEKIVIGRLKKKFEDVALLGQKWLKDEERTVQQVLKETIAKLGENIVIRRFARLTLGEGIEKKDADFAAGVEAELSKYRQ
eukprot:TRINITY_DN313_c0_g1_i1.p1 TRINITY_DN313_c0_g1~~TRINITY_DN313_c0_g1_i1.p1  ORF type:complete len:757 (-),score=226.83 TRINITY_DN313_c0_g1_i1:44-2314(-)